MIFSDTLCSEVYLVFLRYILAPENFDFMVERFLIPSLFSLLLISSMFPSNSRTSFIGSLCTSSDILQLLGQCSLAIYIYQSVFVTFYYDYFVSGLYHFRFPFTRDFAVSHTDILFEKKSIYQVSIGVVLSICFSVVVQKKVQDKVAMYLHNLLLRVHAPIYREE